jgi:Tol biopolymer transport system component
MPEAAAVRDQLAKVLASSIFATSPRMSRFLAFIVNETLAGKSQQIKESVIAREVFGKQHDYDPRADSTVRTEASKLRSRLDRYYQEAGQSDSVIISIPKGSYVPIFGESCSAPSPADLQRAAPDRDAATVRPSVAAKRVFWGLMAILCATAALITLSRLNLRSASKSPVFSFRTTTLTTLPGAEWSPTFSPDGSQVAFVWDGQRQDNADIYAKVIGTNGGLPLRLTSDPAPDLDPAWSPDGRWIAFRRITSSEQRIYLVSPLGTGAEQQILSLPCHGGHCSSRLWANRISWSADGRFLVISEALSPHSPGNFLLVNAVTHETRKLNLPVGAAFTSASQPAFSPDARNLAFVAGETGSEHIYVQALGNSVELVGTPISLVQAGGYPEFVWTKDSQNLVCCVGGHCWLHSLDGRYRNTVRQQLGFTFAIAPNGNRLSYSTGSPLGDTVSGIRHVSRTMNGTAEFISSSCSSTSPEYSDDGNKVVFTSCMGGTGEVWVCSSRGTNCLQITSLAFAGSPRFSPDGRYVAFDSAKYGSWDIFIEDAGGGSPRRLTYEKSADSRPSWSRDGRWVYFSSDRSGDFEIWKAPVAGGTATQITKKGGYEAVESRDGRDLYYVKRGEQGIWTTPVAGGPETLVVNRGEEGMWAPGARGLYLLSRGVESTIDYFDLTTKSFSRVRLLPATNATAMLGVGPEFAVSPDEQSFLYTAVERYEKDLMLLEDFHGL